MRKITASHLTEKVKFLKRKLTLNLEGDYEEEWVEGEERWAMVKPLDTFNRSPLSEWHSLPVSTGKNFYKVTMRKNVNRNALHAEQDTLLYKYKILDILFPFRSSLSQDWVEAVFTDTGKRINNG